MIDKLLSLSIKTKITFTVFLIILFLSGAIIYTIKSSLAKNLENSSVKIVQELVAVNEASIIKSILEDDYWSIYNRLKSLAKLNIIQDIGVVDTQKRVIAHTNTKEYRIYDKFNLKAFDGIKIALKSDNIQFGTCVVKINKNALKALFKDMDKQIYLYIIALALLSFAMAYFISERILKRLNILSYNAKCIQEGKLEKLQQYKSIEKDEITKFQDSMEIILKQLNDALASEQKLKSFYHKILQGLNEFIVITSREFAIKFQNDHSYKEIILENGALKRELLESIQTSLSKEIKRSVITVQNGDELLYLYTIIEEIGDMYAISFTDITKLKTLEEKEQLANSFELIGEISASVVHEIKNYLQPVKLLMEQEDLDREDYQRITAIIAKADTLVNDFLSIGRPIDKNLSESIEINMAIEQQLFLFTANLKRKNITLIKKYTDGLKVNIANYDFELIVANLLKNAIEASFENGTIEIKTEQKDGFKCFTIANEGKPIDKDIIESISKPFFTTKKRGSGLGLYTTYKIVYLYGGYIEVHSSTHGTSFSIYLP